MKRDSFPIRWHLFLFQTRWLILLLFLAVKVSKSFAHFEAHKVRVAMIYICTQFSFFWIWLNQCNFFYYFRQRVTQLPYAIFHFHPLQQVLFSINVYGKVNLILSLIVADTNSREINCRHRCETSLTLFFLYISFHIVLCSRLIVSVFVCVFNLCQMGVRAHVGKLVACLLCSCDVDDLTYSQHIVISFMKYWNVMLDELCII